MKQMKFARQSGFTLVEIAIVLVIIGLLLGGVLKGQELIDNSKAKSIVSDLKGVQAAYNGYLDRYKALPGDDTAAAMTARGWTGAAAGNGNGVLAITLADTFANGNIEHNALWRGLRASGLMSGDPTAPAGQASLPRNSVGGLIGVTNGGAAGGLVYGRAGVHVCASGLTTKVAAAVDALIDGAGAANNTGDLRAATGGAPLAPTAAAPAAAAYNDNTATPWTVCMRIG